MGILKCWSFLHVDHVLIMKHYITANWTGIFLMLNLFISKMGFSSLHDHTITYWIQNCIVCKLFNRFHLGRWRSFCLFNIFHIRANMQDFHTWMFEDNECTCLLYYCISGDTLGSTWRMYCDCSIKLLYVTVCKEPTNALIHKNLMMFFLTFTSMYCSL